MSNYNPFVKPIQHSMHRRAKFCDYRSPGFFMITIRKNPAIASWCEITGSPFSSDSIDSPKVNHTPIGEILYDCIYKIESLHPEYLRITESIIMPDHLHFIVRILKELPRHLGKYIRGMMAAATFRYKAANNIETNISLFEKADKGSYNDRPLYSKNQLDAQIKYIQDNPRRYLIKKAFPRLFSTILDLKFGEYRMNAYGNIFLLRQSIRFPVHVRSAWSAEEFERYKEHCLEISESGGVLISPFISSREKEIRDEALKRGGAIIRITNHNFPKFWKPAKSEFEFCAEGRLLLLTEASSPNLEPDLSRAACLRMNQIAERIAEAAPDTPSSFSGEGMQRGYRMEEKGVRG